MGVMKMENNSLQTDTTYHSGASVLAITLPKFPDAITLFMATCMYVCMGGSYRCIVLDALLENGTGRRTMTMVAPLLLTSSLARYEAVLHGCGTSPVVCCLHPSNI